jgi:hypothetical protein
MITRWVIDNSGESHYENFQKPGQAAYIFIPLSVKERLASGSFPTAPASKSKIIYTT